MEQTRSLILKVVVVFLTVCSPVTQGKLFILEDKETSKPCILVDVEFVLDLTAVRGDKIVAKARVSSEDEGVGIGGSCGDTSGILDLSYLNGVNWVLKFRQDPDKQVHLNRTIQFIPNKVFGQAVPVTQYQLMGDSRVTSLGNTANSYECPVTEIVNYQPLAVTTIKTNFTATAHVSYFHAQAFNLYDGSFTSQVFLCIAARAATQASEVNSASTEVLKTTTEALNTTTPKPCPAGPPVNLYTVRGGDTTCIVLKAALTLNIKYPVEGKGKTKITKLFVPADATISGNCKLSATSQELSISFFKNWKLNFFFVISKKSLLESLTLSTNDKHPKYRIGRIELFGVADKEKFPGATWPAARKLNFTSGKINLPEVGTTEDYYKCESSLSSTLLSDATVESQKLEMKAFNTDNNVDFYGRAAQCAADTWRIHRYIIAGCVVAALLVSCFIFFMVMSAIRKRHYRSF